MLQEDEAGGPAGPPPQAAWRGWTWAAIVTSIALMVPGVVLGGIVQWLYMLFAGGYLGDTVFSWIGLDVVDRFFLMVVPAIIQGCFAGFFVIWLTGVIFPRANFTAVTYTFCTVVACLTLLTLAMAVYNEDLVSLETVVFTVSGISTIAAAHFAKRGVEEDQSEA